MMAKKTLIGLGLILALLATIGLAEAVRLDLGDAVGARGGAVKILISLSSEGSAVVGTSNEILYDPAALTNPKASINSSIGSDTETGKQVFYNTVEDGVFRVGVFGLNLAPIPEGVIAWVTFDVVKDAIMGRAVELKNRPGASDRDGHMLPIAGRDGRIYISGTAATIKAEPAATPPVSITISPDSGKVTSPIDLTIKVSEITGIESVMEDGFSVFLNGEDITSFLVNSGAVSVNAEKGEATLSVHGLSLPEGDYEINAYLGNLSGYIGHGSVKYSVAAD